MKRRQPAALLCALAAVASPPAGGAAVSRLEAGWGRGATTDATARIVELPGDGDDRDVLSNAMDAAEERGVGSGSEDGSIFDAATVPLHLRHQPLDDDAHHVSHPSRQHRRLLLDGTLPTENGALLLSPHHEKLETSYNGAIASSSIEFSLGNERTDGQYLVISGLGLHVSRHIKPEKECRIKVYTRHRPANADAAAINEEYALALDAKVKCAGEGRETLLSSDLFAQSYRQRMETKSSAGAEGMTLHGGGNGRRRAEGWGDLGAVGHPDDGTAAGDSLAASNATAAPDDEDTGGLTSEERRHPLLIGPAETLSFYIVVMPSDGAAPSNSFLFLSSAGTSNGGDVATIEDGTLAKQALEGRPGAVHLSSDPPSLTLYEGSSVTNGVEGGTVDETMIMRVQSPTVLDGAIYYDVLDPATTSLDEYYAELQYSLLPGDPSHRDAGCARSVETGYVDTTGSYGVMFDVSNAAEAVESSLGETKEDSFLSSFRNVEVYNLDLYIRNVVNASFEVYVRTNDGGGYESYSNQEGQTLIAENWELVAMGVVEGQGPGVGSPLPADAWHKTVAIEPGQSVGFYVTVKDRPDLRYRNSTLPEGGIYASDDVVNVGVGRAWGAYPLRGNGGDVYFAQRQFAGAVRYRVHESFDLCETLAPSAAPSRPPTESAAPTMADQNAYAALAEEEGLCPEDGKLEAGFQDGTGSYGVLFDTLAKTDVTVTGINLNVDWNSGSSAHLLVYARQGSWFGHQNNADSWPYLLVNATIARPADFHNRSEDGPYIPVEAKRNSAIVPKKHFKALPMKAGETWSLYVCMSTADLRYTLGTSIGKTFAENSQLRIMEGAGAADSPPFQGGTPEAGGAEYTFYAPRLFNGALRYDYVADCPSAAPSGDFRTTAPSSIPILTTTVSYSFFVEHAEDKRKGAVTYDLSFGVRAVLEKYLAGEEDMLTGYALRHGLVIERVVANLISPEEIGYVCYPDPPDTCTPISVDVTATHRATATTDEILFALLRQSMHLPKQIAVEGYTIEYVGDRAVETKSEITLSNVPEREMGELEQSFFEDVAREFLSAQVTDGSENGSLEILAVTINGQEITSDSLKTGDASTSSLIQKRDNPQRRLQKSNNIQVSVRGTYRPPPEINFGDLVEHSINRDREQLEKELKDRQPPTVEGGEGGDAPSSYFEKAEVVGARQIKEKRMPGPTDNSEEKSDLDAALQYAAMGVGGPSR
ncbi:hypothetical protein ACHAXT_004339 [Thalassiosira profunda]